MSGFDVNFFLGKPNDDYLDNSGKPLSIYIGKFIVDFHYDDSHILLLVDDRENRFNFVFDRESIQINGIDRNEIAQILSKTIMIDNIKIINLSTNLLRISYRISGNTGSPFTFARVFSISNKIQIGSEMAKISVDLKKLLDTDFSLFKRFTKVFQKHVKKEDNFEKLFDESSKKYISIIDPSSTDYSHFPKEHTDLLQEIERISKIREPPVKRLGKIVMFFVKQNYFDFPEFLGQRDLALDLRYEEVTRSLERTTPLSSSELVEKLVASPIKDTLPPEVFSEVRRIVRGILAEDKDGTSRVSLRTLIGKSKTRKHLGRHKRRSSGTQRKRRHCS